ncbi:MAG: ATP-dependent RNA helicase DbpA [Pseudomonadota bacterium]
MTPTTSKRFASLNIAAKQLKNLGDLGYETMTPIQAQSLPVILSGKDVIAQAKTGSGKTAAFGIGLLEKVDSTKPDVQAMVLCPTRELADQVGRELRSLARAVDNTKLVSLCGGKPFGPQKATLQYGAHIVVGTPGRLLDHLQRGTLHLGKLQTLVFDEADRMLDMGFAEPIKDIMRFVPRKRQTLLFSATYPAEIQAIGTAFLKNPSMVSVDAEHSGEAIEQLFYEVNHHERNKTLLALFCHYKLNAALVFCQTKVDCDQVAAMLQQNHIHALAIHGDLDQRERDRVLLQFANSSCAVLVATDVAARGLDMKSLPAVINYELPRDAQTYIHRIGRTGRAGASGLALSIVTQSEQARLRNIEKYLNEPCVCDVYASLDQDPGYAVRAPMVTVEINAGRKQKFRPGDILGGLTGMGGLPASAIGKIDILDMNSFVAIEKRAVKSTLEFLSEGKIKGRSVKARQI